MRLQYEMNLEQQQKLLITPELRQAIAILQMAAPELEEYVSQEVEKNPFLELAEESGSKEGEEPIERSPQDEVTEWLDYFTDRSDLGITGDRDQEKPLEGSWSATTNLQDYLTLQLRLALNNNIDRRIGQYLIGCIDDRGYLAITVDEAAAALAVSVEKVSEILSVIQGFDPPGIGGRDLREVLTIQLKQRNLDTPLLLELVDQHLPEIAAGKLKAVAKELGISVQEVQEMCDVLRTLNPHPGSQFGGEDANRYLIPDVMVEKINGQYVISLNDSGIPSLRINHLYQELLKNPGQFSKDEQKYLEERLASAVWLIKSIEHRKVTLYRVVSCIVEMQKEFLDYGVKYLKPLTLKQVAEKVGMHESTISRTTTNKYVQTPRGVFELKFFFSSSLKGAEMEEAVSARSTKRLIKELIEAEDKTNPLSDQQICDYLQQQGITCSRRTVAKYRAELGIAQVAARRRY